MGGRPGVAKLDDVLASAGGSAHSSDFMDGLTQRCDEPVVVQRGIFEGRHARFIDADGRRNYSGDPSLSETLLEMRPRWRYSPIIKRVSPTHGRPKDSVAEINVPDAKRLK